MRRLPAPQYLCRFSLYSGGLRAGPSKRSTLTNLPILVQSLILGTCLIGRRLAHKLALEVIRSGHLRVEVAKLFRQTNVTEGALKNTMKFASLCAVSLCLVVVSAAQNAAKVATLAVISE